MRKTTLYTLQETAVLAGDIHAIYNNHLGTKDIIEMPDSLGALIPIDRIALPVHHVRKIEHGVHYDKFIALHPKLQEILEAPFVSKYEQMSAKLEDERNKRKEWVESFNAMPWYKRAYAAIRYGII